MSKLTVSNSHLEISIDTNASLFIVVSYKMICIVTLILNLATQYQIPVAVFHQQLH